MGYEVDRPTDQCDIADLEIQRQIDRSVGEILKRKPLTPNGKCLDCNESVAEGELFCDSECRDEYEWYCGRIGK